MVLFSVVAFLGGQISSTTPDQMARRLERRYRLLKTLSMDFIKIIKSEVFETQEKIKGKMIFKNPDKFKIKTEDQTMVCDGKFLWTYSVENQQVIKNLVSRSEKIFQPIQYLTNFRAEYIPKSLGEEKVGRTKCFKLLLSPKKEEAFIKRMVLWIDQKNLLVKKLKYKDYNDNEVTFIFSHIKTNRKIKDSEFILQTPPGVEEVDLSK